MSRGVPRRPSLRVMSRIGMAAIAASIVALVALVLVAGKLFDRATAMLADATIGLQLATELDDQLGSHDRLSNLYAATSEPGVRAERDKIEPAMTSLLDEADGKATTPTEHELLQRVRGALDEHFVARRRAEDSGASVKEVIGRSQPSLEAVLTELSALRDVNSAELDVANEQVARLRVALAASGVTIGVVAAALLVMLFLAQWRYLYSPLRSLTDSIRRVTGPNEGGVRASEELPVELRQVAHAVNRLCDHIDWQRQNELLYLASVGHDLRDPLGALSAGIGVVQKRLPSDPQTDKTLSLMERQVARLNRLLSDVLDMAKIEAGGLELDTETIDVRRVVEEAVVTYRPTDGAREVILSAPSEPLLVTCDPRRIEQVLGTLITNALKCSPSGNRVEVTVRSAPTEAVLTVADRCTDIPADALAEVFAPFWRPRTEGRPAAGLGLSVARRIVDAHRGRIEVTSAPRAGSTFTVHLPRVDLLPQ